MPDPGAGYTLYKVVRSDGTPIRVGDQAWTTDRTFDSAGVSHIDYELHLLDDNSSGIYTVYFKPAVTGPVSVASVGPVSSPQAGALNSVPVAFNEPIDPTTFTSANLSLSLNGGPNLIAANSGITITQISPSTFNIGGLDILTASGGNYVLTVTAAGIEDPFGDVGAGSLSAGWATAGNQPVIVSVGAKNPARRNSPLDTATVIFTQAINPNSFDDSDISLTLGSNPTNRITSGVTITQLSDTTYQISGLSSLTAADGIYTLTINTSGVSDMQGDSGVGSASETWTTSTVAPTIAVLQDGFQSPRNIVVPSIDVTFSEPIDPTTFTYKDITYSKTGGPNLITSAITIAPIAGTDNTEFEISNFNNFVSSIDGSYTFTVNTAGVTDLYGNVATGAEAGSTASDTFVLQTTAPAAPTGLAISPDTGVSATDNLTDTGHITLTGTIAAPGLTVEVYDGLTNHLADAIVTGTTFSASLSLAPGSHNLRVYAVDSAANVSADSYDMIFVDTTPPTAIFTTPTQATPQSAVSSVQFSFGKIIDGTSLTPDDLSLTLNGGPNLIDAGVSIHLVSAATNTYEIDGLASLNSSPGAYVLTLNTNQVRDLAGNSGLAPTIASWTVAPAKVAASFSNLTAFQVLNRGTASIILSGTVSGGSTLLSAGETVSITLNGVTQNATINASGGFAASFDVSALPVSSTPYPVTYAYSGDSGLLPVSDSTTTALRIFALPATGTLSAAPSQIIYDGTADVTAWASATLSGAANGLSPTGSTTLQFYVGAAPIGTPMSSPPVNAGVYTVVASYNGDANFSAAQSAPLTFTISRATPTVTLSSPPASITYDSTNSVTAWVKATISGVSGAPAPSGPISYIYYTGTTASGTPLSAPPVNAGTYTVVAAYGGNSNYLSGQSGPVTFTISQPTAALSAFFKVDDGTAQRSMVRSLTVTFSSAVSIQNGAITLTDNLGNPIAFTLSTTDNTVFTLTFSGSQFIGRSLANGRYVLTVHSALVNAGSAHLSGDQTLNFWRLFGDFYGTGTVNNADKSLFAQVYKGLNPSYSSYFDYDANGVFNASDLNAFTQDFGKSI